MLQKTNDNIIMVVKNSTKCIELYGGDLLEYKYRYVCICAIVWCYANKLCQYVPLSGDKLCQPFRIKI